jgi:hypothetical protein
MDELHTSNGMQVCFLGDRYQIQATHHQNIRHSSMHRYTLRVVQHSDPLPLVATLVGEAIATLAELGVSPQVLGEFAMRFPGRAAASLGTQLSPSEPTDLEKVVFEQVTRALRADRGMRVSPQQTSAKRRVNVLVKGQRTSVTISAELIQEADRLTGSRAAGRQLIQQLAEQAPPETPRSTWTEQQLHQRLLFLASAPAADRQH